MKRCSIFLLALVLSMVVVAGCSTGADAVDPAQDYLDNSVTNMSGLAGYQFSLAHTGPSVYVDADGTTEFLNASGYYVSPDKVNTTIKIVALGMIAEVSVISIGEDQWLSTPFSKFQPLDDSYAYKPTLLFDPEMGFFVMLQNDLTDLALLGEEEIEEMPGLPLQHLTGSLSGEVVLEVSYNLIDAESVAVDIWLDGNSNEIHRVVLTEPVPDESEEASVWQIDFWSFGDTVEITTP